MDIVVGWCWFIFYYFCWDVIGMFFFPVVNGVAIGHLSRTFARLLLLIKMYWGFKNILYHIGVLLFRLSYTKSNLPSYSLIVGEYPSNKTGPIRSYWRENLEREITKVEISYLWLINDIEYYTHLIDFWYGIK